MCAFLSDILALLSMHQCVCLFIWIPGPYLYFLYLYLHVNVSLSPVYARVCVCVWMNLPFSPSHQLCSMLAMGVVLLGSYGLVRLFQLWSSPITFLWLTWIIGWHVRKRLYLICLFNFCLFSPFLESIISGKVWKIDIVDLYYLAFILFWYKSDFTFSLNY